MDSFFFNITDRRYKITKLYKQTKRYISRVDISNGIVFLDISLTKEMKQFPLKNLDRMLMIAVVNKGTLTIDDHISLTRKSLKESEIGMYCSSRQDMTLTIDEAEQSDIFILFIADFFLKRYLSSKKNEPIDFLYHKIQGELSFEEVNVQPIDALSLYIIDKIINIKSSDTMHSIRCEHSVTEFMIHRFSLFDMIDESIDKEERQIALKAKKQILKNFINPLTIQVLAHLCATNESKLKKVFKKVYKTTLYSYIQKLRLEEANLLLKEQSLTIGEIANRVGYKHQGHFSKLFFSTYGVYPKELMKR